MWDCPRRTFKLTNRIEFFSHVRSLDSQLGFRFFDGLAVKFQWPSKPIYITKAPLFLSLPHTSLFNPFVTLNFRPLLSPSLFRSNIWSTISFITAFTLINLYSHLWIPFGFLLYILHIKHIITVLFRLNSAQNSLNHTEMSSDGKSMVSGAFKSEKPKGAAADSAPGTTKLNSAPNVSYDLSIGVPHSKNTGVSIGRPKPKRTTGNKSIYAWLT